MTECLFFLGPEEGSGVGGGFGVQGLRFRNKAAQILSGSFRQAALAVEIASAFDVEPCFRDASNRTR